MGKSKRKQIEKEIEKIADTVNIDFTNGIIETSNELENFNLSKKTLLNIAKWALDGKSEFEIRQNLELSKQEWQFLVKVCPTILVIMQHSTAYADMVVAGTLLQTAIDGHTILKKVPMKIKEYNDEGKVIGEHVEIVEYPEVQPSNPMLLKYLAENKLSEKFGNSKVDNSKEHREIVDELTPETMKIIESMAENNGEQ